MVRNKDYEDFVKRMNSFEEIIDIEDRIDIEEDELQHYGIEGMRWGVRRRSNSGSTTARERVKNIKNKVVSNSGKSLVDNMSKTATNISNLDKSMLSAQKSKNKNIDLSEITDEDLKKAITRFTLENQYKNAIAESNVSAGRMRASAILDVGGSALAVTGSALGIALAIKSLKG